MTRQVALCIVLLLTLPAIGLGVDSQPAIPQTLEQLWADFAVLDKSTPLAVEVLKEWEQEDVVCRLLRYQVGVFKGSPSRVAGFYAFPKGGTKLPAILELHGGGQSASLPSVVTYAKRGYASLSLNWGGNGLRIGTESWAGPQTDWGQLDATHPPQRNKVNHFAGPLTPDEFTLDAEVSPRNSNWFLVLLAARRAISLLEQQPEIDAARIGVHGHSMGGKLTTNLAGIDKRIKAAVPSCGGSGDLSESETVVPGGHRASLTPTEQACISDNAYLPLISCPILWLSPTNDFHGHIDNMAWNWRNLPDNRVRFSISPHLNHRHTDEHSITEYLWFEQHLKGDSFRMPQTPHLGLELSTTSGVPRVTVTPDESQPVQRVDIYYSLDPHALTRFWRDATAEKSGNRWQADCPVMSLDQPLFVYANVAYETPAAYRSGPQPPGVHNSDTFAISSRVVSVGPTSLRAAGVKATDARDRLIDDGTRGWHDWYRLNWDHPPLWTATTRKLKDPKWRGPEQSTLSFEVQCESDNQLVLTFHCNGWGAILPGKPAVDYSVVKSLTGSSNWQTVSVQLAELAATDPSVTAPLTDWQLVTEFSISPSGKARDHGQIRTVVGQPWHGPRAIRNLRWEGGEYADTR